MEVGEVFRVEAPESDRALLEGIKRDEPAAFDEFVTRYGDRIYGFGMRFCGEREDARDVAQETLLQAFRSLKRLKEPAALRSWLYRVAANACLMKRRKGKFEPARELSLEELKPVGLGEAAFEIPDESSRPDDAALRSQLQESVKRAIRTLPRHYRIVIVLRDLEQLSTREVAHALSVAESTVKMRLHRARSMVRKLVRDDLDGSGAEST